MRTHVATRLLALIWSPRYVARIQTSLNSCDRSQRQNSVAATIGTLSTDDDEPRGRRPEVKFPLTALLRKLDSSSSCSSGRQNVRFAVQSEREYVLIYFPSVSDRKFISNYWNESWLFINFVNLYKLDSTASLVLKSLVITFLFWVCRFVRCQEFACQRK